MKVVSPAFRKGHEDERDRVVAAYFSAVEQLTDDDYEIDYDWALFSQVLASWFDEDCACEYTDEQFEASVAEAHEIVETFAKHVRSKRAKAKQKRGKR